MRNIALVFCIFAFCCSIAFSQSSVEEALIEKLRKESARDVALETVLSESDQYSAAVLFIGAKVAFDEDRLEDSGFLFYSAQLRYRFDLECFPPKETGGDSPFQFYAVLSSNVGLVISPAIMAEPAVFAKAIDRVKEWTPKATGDYDPGYDFTERKSEQEAAKAVDPKRTEFVNRMTDLAFLLSHVEYFAAFQIIQARNFSEDSSGPTVEEYDNAVAAMKEIEKAKGLKGFFSEEEPRNNAGKGYRKVGDAWHYYGREIKGADLETFEVFKGSEFAKDNDQVYVSGYVVAGADPKTFTFVRGPYGKDAAKVYCGNVAMSVQDVDAFEVVSWDGMWNQTFDESWFVFDYGEQFKGIGISVENPAVTGAAVGRDGIAYYYGPAQIEGADYASFEVAEGSVSNDKNREFTGPFPTDSWPQRRKDILGLD